MLQSLLVPWSIWIGARIQSLTSGRKWTAISIRTVILLCLILALAGAELVRVEDKLAVFFLLDHSDSVSEDARLESAQWVRNVAGEGPGWTQQRHLSSMDLPTVNA